ncbi:MAG: hypothetical protein UT11_C0038G0006 [Berkelbacteria bacterium GW2011_GWA2_38_9]|uniref:RlpA-like protein double-psi beta-barrel domain-containing protein n=1 Tax=Berkelbacteria bacterium GW2011_GWA2_38_9 TaxID=1618334 RepID=A0A0G0NQQ9_9BACT|nr:MAG: hypothetical protein UT11_C0038G0006 [Berkelbacteria bacterium GW2011_GWA2_38_9]
MKKLNYLTIYVLVAVFLLTASPLALSTSWAASDGDLVQVSKSGSVYLIEGNFKRKIKDADTLSNLCWSGIQSISKSELNSISTGPDFTRVIRYGGNIYVLQNCQKRYVTSIEALSWNGFLLSDMHDVNTATFNHWSDGPNLTTPKLMRAPGSATIYFVDSGVRRAIKDGGVFGHWHFSSGDVVTSKKVLDYPKGADLTRLVFFNGNAYGVDAGTFRYAGDEFHMRVNGYDPRDLVAVGSDAANFLQIGANLSIPRVIKDESTGTKYLVDGDVLRKFTSDYAYYEWGLTDGDITKVGSIVSGLSVSSTLNLLARDAGGQYWLARYSTRRLIPDSDTFNDYGLSDQQASSVSNEFLRSIREGETLERGTDKLEGNSIPATSGKTAREQHLYLSEEEYNLGRTDASASKHYSVSSTSSAAQNGMAGGFGAFGSIASPASTSQERYYINMRWNYGSWYEDCGSVSDGHCTTRTSNVDIVNKGWHRHKKVIVKNPTNNRRIVVSVEESGPAIWTDRVSGLSPEAMEELGASTNDNLEYRWAVNQNLTLGRLY